MLGKCWGIMISLHAAPALRSVSATSKSEVCLLVTSYYACFHEQSVASAEGGS